MNLISTLDFLKVILVICATPLNYVHQKEHEEHLSFAKCGYKTSSYDISLVKQSWKAVCDQSSDS